MQKGVANSESDEAAAIQNLSADDRSAFEKLKRQRDLHQISAYKFEESKQALLGVEPAKERVLFNWFVLASIAAFILLGSYILYPRNTSSFSNVADNMVTNWGERSVLALPGKVRRVKETSDEVADQLFKECELLVCESQMYPNGRKPAD